MKKKYRIKNRVNNNAFSALTGIEAIEVVNPNCCLVVKQLSANGGIPITKYAYCIYYNYPTSLNITVSHTCDIENCVRQDHLIATYRPSKKDLEHIDMYKNIDDMKTIAEYLKVPLDLFRPFWKTLK